MTNGNSTKDHPCDVSGCWGPFDGSVAFWGEVLWFRFVQRQCRDELGIPKGWCHVDCLTSMPTQSNRSNRFLRKTARIVFFFLSLHGREAPEGSQGTKAGDEAHGVTSTIGCVPFLRVPVLVGLNEKPRGKPLLLLLLLLLPFCLLGGCPKGKTPNSQQTLANPESKGGLASCSPL